ncbi:hypothetical protein M433DRAFT_9163 [Acidomyces richmondensis BFW]|nr:hypothetical protein M433DRAFT_9163 [Acidomyces richmondensis BFW]
MWDPRGLPGSVPGCHSPWLDTEPQFARDQTDLIRLHNGLLYVEQVLGVMVLLSLHVFLAVSPSMLERSQAPSPAAAASAALSEHTNTPSSPPPSPGVAPLLFVARRIGG